MQACTVVVSQAFATSNHLASSAGGQLKRFLVPALALPHLATFFGMLAGLVVGKVVLALQIGWTLGNFVE